MYNGGGAGGADDSLGSGKMRKTLTTIRCVPRFGYDYAQVRTIELDRIDAASEEELLATLREWFALCGMPDAVFGTDVDDYGIYAIINDEAYQTEWGMPLL